MIALSRLRRAGVIAATALTLAGGVLAEPVRAEGGPDAGVEGEPDAEAVAAAAQAKAARLRAARIKAARVKAAKAAAAKAAEAKAAADAQDKARAEAVRALQAPPLPPPAPPPPPRPTFETVRCANTLIVSTVHGYHTAGEGDLYLDLLGQDDGHVSFRIHPGVFPSVALSLRDCVLATCSGTMTRDSYTLADRRTAGDARVTIDIGRINSQYVATAETRDAKGAVTQVLTERGTCQPADPAARF